MLNLNDKNFKVLVSLVGSIPEEKISAMLLLNLILLKQGFLQQPVILKLRENLNALIERLLSHPYNFTREQFEEEANTLISDFAQKNQHRELSDLITVIANLVFENKVSSLSFGLFKKYLYSKNSKTIIHKAMLLGANRNLFSRHYQDTSLALVIYTQMLTDGLGDYYAAVTLIRLLKLKNPNLKLTWIIEGQITPSDPLPLFDVTIYIISEQNQVLVDKTIGKSVTQSQAIFIFPSCNSYSQLPEKFIDQLKMRYAIPVFSGLEYSYNPLMRRYGRDKVELVTGLGSDELGIFIRNYDRSRPFLDQIAEDQPIKSILGPADTHVLFFGYVSKETRVQNPFINIANFIQTCLIVARKQQPRKHVDIIVPISLEEVQHLTFDRAFYCEIQFISKSGKQIIYNNFQQNANRTVLRIINLFHFNSHTFQMLMAASHPFKLFTGDQSFSDAVSSIDCIPAYQIMIWKKSLFDNYRNVAKSLLKNEAIAISYLDAMEGIDSQPSPERMAEFVLDPELLEQFEKIHRQIIQDHNLNERLTTGLLNLLSYLRDEETWLGATPKMGRNPAVFLPGHASTDSKSVPQSAVSIPSYNQ